MRTFLRATLLFLALDGAVSVALACSCAGPADPSESLNASDQVFVGIAGGTRPGCGCGQDPFRGVATRFEVKTPIKGVEPGENVSVDHSGNESSCGVNFEKGERWLVFATDGATHLCEANVRDPSPALIDSLLGE